MDVPSSPWNFANWLLGVWLEGLDSVDVVHDVLDLGDTLKDIVELKHELVH